MEWCVPSSVTSDQGSSSSRNIRHLLVENEEYILQYILFIVVGGIILKHILGTSKLGINHTCKG